MTQIIILKGIAGSTAHGLAHAGSDIDVHGVYSYHTNDFWTLRKPVESIVQHEPDLSMHELEKLLRLGLKSNPSILELLWLDDYLEKEPIWGDQLISIRESFLSARAVRGAYLGYANDQFDKFERYTKSTEKGGPSEDGIRRAKKNAKHILRLVEQGSRLYTTGELRVRVDHPDAYHAIMTWSLEEILEYARKRVAEFEGLTSTLPEEPDYDTVADFLYRYRAYHTR